MKNTTASDLVAKAKKEFGQNAVKTCIFAVEHLVTYCPISTDPDEREKGFHEHWESVLGELVGMLEPKTQQPHCCPVCSGKGVVPNGFYNSTDTSWSTSSITPDQCKPCKGTGIVWR